MQNYNQNKFQLTYSDNIESIEGNIIKVNADFMEILKQEEPIVIEGKNQDQFIFSVRDKSFKLRGIFLPTTMLVTPGLGSVDLQDNSNSNPPAKLVAKILLETYNYLKIDSHEIQFQKILTQISLQALGSRIITEKMPLYFILQNEGITLSDIKSRYRITKDHIQKMAEVAPITFFRGDDDFLLIQLNNSFMCQYMRDLMPIIVSPQFLGGWFTYSQLAAAKNLIDYKFFEVIARFFSIEAKPPLSDPKIEQNEPIAEQRQFRITIDTIVRFILSEIANTTNKITKQHFTESSSNLLAVYLPVGYQEFAESKARQRLAELTGQYFVSTLYENSQFYIYYNPLFMDFNPKARIQQMSSYKKKFSRSQINGFFFKWYSSSEVQDILLKHFRKMGKEFEIKLIIPK